MYYYVDNNNLARRFSDENSQSWLRKDSSCPESSKELTDEEFNKLRKWEVYQWVLESYV